MPARPAGLYRITQGVHVTAGFASIPVLLAKLWVVSPKLVEWPAVKSPRHALERLALLPLVGGGVFLLMSGVANLARWYPWHFYFPAAHYWTAWIAIGAMVAHIGATWTTSRATLRRRRRLSFPDRYALDDERVDRRRFLGGVAAAAGVLVAATVGGTIGTLSPIAFLSQRRSHFGPQGLPVNKTARQARVLPAVTDPAWRMKVTGNVREELSLSRADLAAMPSTRLISRSPASRAGRRRRTGPASRCTRSSAGPVRPPTPACGSTPPRRAAGTRAPTSTASRPTTATPCWPPTSTAPSCTRTTATPFASSRPNRAGVDQTKWVAEVEVL